jgi:hypothetical protein
MSVSHLSAEQRFVPGFAIRYPVASKRLLLLMKLKKGWSMPTVPFLSGHLEETW